MSSHRILATVRSRCPVNSSTLINAPVGAVRDEQKLQDYLLRELMSENKLRYPVVQKINGELKTVMIEKNGPVAFMVTTTFNKLNSENETRMLSLEINDSQDQTQRVLDKIAELEGRNRAELKYRPRTLAQLSTLVGGRAISKSTSRSRAPGLPDPTESGSPASRLQSASARRESARVAASEAPRA